MVSILTIDNYEELIRNATDNRRTQVRSGIEREISQWIAPAHGLLCRYDRDRYLFIFEEQYLAAYRQNKFALLEAVQKVTGPTASAPPSPSASAWAPPSTRCSSSPSWPWRWP